MTVVRWARPLSLVLVLAVILALVQGLKAMPSARANTSTTFSFVGTNQATGTVQTWLVPADVTSIFITARGGDGAGDTMPNSDPRKYGGHGAVVETTAPVSVTPGAVLSIYVAGRGDPGRGNNAAGKGGWGYGSGGQGGSGYAGGGGGGASAVVSDLDGLLIVAGGGGGAGAALGADGGTAAFGGAAPGGDGLTVGGGVGGSGGNGGAAGAPVSAGVDPTAGLAFASGGDGGVGAKWASGSRSYPFGGGGGGGYGGGGGGGGSGTGAGGGAGGSFSAVAATYTPSTLPWSTGDLRVGNPGEVIITTLAQTPTFDTPVQTDDGFTVNVTNYDPLWTWGLSASSGAATAGVASGATLPITVSGVAPGTSATLTVATSRTGYPAGSADVTGSALLAGMAPTFDSPTSTIDGFSVNVTNYDGSWTWTPSVTSGVVTAGTPSGALLPLVVTGLSRGVSAAVTMTTARSGYASESAAVTGSSIPPPPVFPPSVPLEVTGVAGDGSVSVSWSPPAFRGSFPVSTYQVTSSPAGGSCLVSVTSCEVSGLSNGTAYTFTVRALNGAGWGPWSAASAAVTPVAPVTPSIVITGWRGEVRGRPGIVVAGSSTLEAGAVVRPWVRFRGQTAYAEGSARVLVDNAGAFTWERRTGKRVSVYMAIDGLESNRIVIRPSAP